MLDYTKRKIKTIKKEYLLKKENLKQIKKNVDFQNALSKYGKNLEIFGDIDVAYPQRITIGNDCKLNHRVYLNGRSSIVIGDDVTVSYGAKLISTGYDLDLWIKEGVKKHFEDKPIVIGNHCWVGAGAIILPGVNIVGEYVVIAAGSVVTKDITESYVVVAGSPARVVKKLEI